MLELEIEETGDRLDAARAAIARAVDAGRARSTIDGIAARFGVAWGIAWTGAVLVLETGDDDGLF